MSGIISNNAFNSVNRMYGSFGSSLRATGMDSNTREESVIIPNIFKTEKIIPTERPVSKYLGNSKITYYKVDGNPPTLYAFYDSKAPAIKDSTKVRPILFPAGFVDPESSGIPLDTDAEALYQYNGNEGVTQKKTVVNGEPNKVFYLNTANGILFPIAYFSLPYFQGSFTPKTEEINPKADLVDRFHKVDLDGPDEDPSNFALKPGGDTNNQNDVESSTYREVLVIGFEDANGDFQQVNMEFNNLKNLKDILKGNQSPVKDYLIAKHFPGRTEQEVTWYIKKKLVYDELKLKGGAQYRDIVLMTDNANAISFTITHKLEHQPRNLIADAPVYNVEAKANGSKIKINVGGISFPTDITGLEAGERRWTLKVKNKATGTIEEISTATGLTLEKLAKDVFGEASLVQGEDGKYTLTGNLQGIIKDKELKIFDQNYECYIDYTDTVDIIDDDDNKTTTTINSLGRIVLSSAEKPALNNEERILTADSPKHDIEVNEQGNLLKVKQITIDNISWTTDIAGLKDKDRQWFFYVGSEVVLTAEGVNPHDLLAKIMENGYQFEKQENGKYKLTGVLKKNIDGHQIDVFGNTAIYIDYRDKSKVLIDDNGDLVEGLIQSNGKIAFNTIEKKITYQYGDPKLSVKSKQNIIEGSTIFETNTVDKGKTIIAVDGLTVREVPQNFERYELHLDKNVAIVYMNTAGKMVSLYPQRQADNGKYVYEINDENFQYFVSEDAGQGQLYLVVKAVDEKQTELVGVPVTIPENKNLQFDEWRRQDNIPKRLLNFQQEVVLQNIASVQGNATETINFRQLFGNPVSRKIVWRRANGQEYELTTDPARREEKNVLVVSRRVYTLDELKQLIAKKENIVDSAKIVDLDLSSDTIVAIPENFKLNFGFTIGNNLVNDPLSAARALHALGQKYQDFLKTGNLKTDFGLNTQADFYFPGARWFRNVLVDGNLKYSLYHQEDNPTTKNNEKGDTQMLNFGVAALTELLSLNKGNFGWSPYFGAALDLRSLLTDTITKLPAFADTFLAFNLGSPFVWNLPDQKLLLTPEVDLKWSRRALTGRDYLDFKAKLMFDWFNYSGHFNGLNLAMGYNLDSSERVKIGGQGNYLATDQHQLNLSGKLNLFNFVTMNTEYAWLKDVFTGKSAHDVKAGLSLNNFGTDSVNFGISTDYRFNSVKNSHRNTLNFIIMPGAKFKINLDGRVDYVKNLPTLWGATAGVQFTPNQWWTTKLSVNVQDLDGTKNPTFGGTLTFGVNY